MTISRKKQKIELLKFISMLFARCNGGFVEIRPFDLNYNLDFENRSFIQVEKKRVIAKRIWELRHGHLFYGVATRTYEGKRKKKGSKEYLKEIPALFADLDRSDYMSWAEMDEIITDFPFEPSSIVFSDHGLHIYYFLAPPVKIKGNTNRIERVLKIIQAKMLKADSTPDSSRTLRAISSENVKVPSKPILVKIKKLKDITYSLKDFEDQFWKILNEGNTSSYKKTRTSNSVVIKEGKIDIEKLRVSRKIKDLILEGNKPEHSYKSRSEADQAVIVGMYASGYSGKIIRKVFEQNPNGIGEKYFEKGNSKEQYLDHSIESAKQFLFS